MKKNLRAAERPLLNELMGHVISLVKDKDGLMEFEDEEISAFVSLEPDGDKVKNALATALEAWGETIRKKTLAAVAEGLEGHRQHMVDYTLAYDCPVCGDRLVDDCACERGWKP